MPSISDLRREYHRQICADILRISQDRGKGEYPNFADGASKVSAEIAWGIVRQIGYPIRAWQPQTPDRRETVRGKDQDIP